MVPLCVDETPSGRARSYARKFELVVWWGTLVEVHGAISRLHRNEELSDFHTQGASARLQLISRSWKELFPSEEIRVLALGTLNRYPLRASDSFQLAAALRWCDERPSRRPFICGDHRLIQAAASMGFTALELV